MEIEAPISGLKGFDAALRRWLPTDAPRLLEAWLDPEVARWNAVPPNPTIELASRWIANDQRRLDQRLSVDLVIDMADHGVIGEVGLSGFSRRHQGALIGYWLLPHGRGQGIATSAVSVTCDWAFDQLDLKVVVARCSPTNEASHRVVQRAGFVHERTDETGLWLWRKYRSEHKAN